MSWRHGAAAVAVLTLAGAAQAQAPTSLPTYDQVGLGWVKMPSLREMARLYPVRAKSMQVRRGRADVACTPDARGRLDCEVVDEWPEGMRFGESAVRVMEQARVTSVDGGSPAGRQFGFTLKYGNWNASSLSAKWHPTEAGLRWVNSPELAQRWSMNGQATGSTLTADLSCVAQADGSVDCDIKSADDPRFGRAALASVEAAKVRAADGRPLAGRSFDWTMKLIRAAHCGGGGRFGGREEITAVQTEAEGSQIGGGGITETYGGAVSSTSTGTVGSSTPACNPVMLQTR